jgi:hypothetical protein
MADYAFPVVKGYAIRVTAINNCGMPVAGPSNRLVTNGFVSVGLTMVTQPAVDLEQSNAEGLICVSDRTPPQRKWYTPAVELCNVDPALISMFSGWPTVLDYAGDAIGYQDATEVQEDYGVALEIWTGGKSVTDCPVPTSDSIFSTATSGLQYGYFLLGGVEWLMGNITLSASVATFTLTGRTIPMPQWGCGPYNVAAINSSGTPGRLLSPLNADSHYTVFRTPVPPPDQTFGAVPLSITSLFNNSNSIYYYGGPGNIPPTPIAPEQPDVSTWTITLTGTPTGGNFSLLLNDLPTGPIPWNATLAQIETIFEATDPQHYVTPVVYDPTNGPLPTNPVAVGLPFYSTLTVETNNLVGGTSPNITLSEVTFTWTG